MNTEELVKLYQEGVRDFSDQSIRNINLDAASFYTFRGSNFQNSDLSEANLKNGDFSKANCQATQFCDAILQNAKLKRANCQQAKFLGADLRNADFSGCDLASADFTGADLRGANLKLALLDSPEHGAANFKGAVYNRHTAFPVNLKLETLGATDGDAMSDQEIKRFQAEVLINLFPSLDPTTLPSISNPQHIPAKVVSSSKPQKPLYRIESSTESAIKINSSFYARVDSFLNPKNTKTYNIKISENHKIKIDQYFSKAWKMTQDKLGNFVGFFLLIALLLIVLNAAPGIGQLILIAIIGPLSAGFLIVSFKMLKNRSVSFEHFFQGFNLFMPLCLEFIVKAMILSIGFICFVVPAVYFGVSYIFSVPLILDRKIDFWPALELSRFIVSKHWLDYLVFVFILVVMNLFGSIPSGLGLLITVPLTYNAIAVAYDDIVGITST